MWTVLLWEQLDLENNAKDYYPDTDQARRLRHATIYSYKGTCKYDYSKEAELVASQALVWAISGKYFDSSTTSLSGNEKTLLNCIKAPNSAAHQNMVDCYKKMKADVLQHGNYPKGTVNNKFFVGKKYNVCTQIQQIHLPLGNNDQHGQLNITIQAAVCQRSDHLQKAVQSLRFPQSESRKKEC